MLLPLLHRPPAKPPLRAPPQHEPRRAPSSSSLVLGDGLADAAAPHAVLAHKAGLVVLLLLVRLQEGGGVQQEAQRGAQLSLSLVVSGGKGPAQPRLLVPSRKRPSLPALCSPSQQQHQQEPTKKPTKPTTLTTRTSLA